MKEEILKAFLDHREELKKVYHTDKFPVRLATINLRIRLWNKYTCAELRKALDEMPEVERDENLSRRGSAVWRLKQCAN